MNKQSGTAVFFALVVVALISAITVIATLQMRSNIHRTQMMLNSEQAYLFARGGIDIAKSIIASGNTQWPQLLNTKVEQISLSGKIEDYQSRLNINNLSDKVSKNAFILLVTLLEPHINREEATGIANNIIAWITPLELLTPGMIAINSTYTNQNPPYQATHRPLFFISELQLIAGMTPSLYSILEPYLAALPPMINVNFTNSNPLILKVFGFNAPPKPLPSQYYLVSINVRKDKQNFNLYALLFMKNIKSKVEIIWESDTF